MNASNPARSATRCRSHRAVWLTLAFAVAEASACVNVCNDGECASMLWIYVTEADDAPLREGTYDITLTRDGMSATSTCEVTADAMSVACDDGLPAILYAPLYGGMSSPHRRFELHVRDDLPAEVEVRVAIDGRVVLDASFRPEYSNPDPGCFDDCSQADHDLVLGP